MCIPLIEKVTAVATIATGLVGLSGCVNVNGNVNFGGSNNTQSVGAHSHEGHKKYTSQQALEPRVCREYHDHTEHCITPRSRSVSSVTKPFTLGETTLPVNFLAQNRVFTCTSFSDKNANDRVDHGELVGYGNTFCQGQPMTIVGWTARGDKAQERPLRFQIYDGSGKQILHQVEPIRTRGSVIAIDTSFLQPGDYIAQVQYNQCGDLTSESQWKSLGKSAFYINDCIPLQHTPCAPRETYVLPMSPGIVGSIK